MVYVPIPAIDQAYLSIVDVYRGMIMDNIGPRGSNNNLNAPPQEVERVLDTILTPTALETFKLWNPQKPTLEEMLITNFLNYVVGINMEPDRGDNRFQYWFATESRCPDHKRPKFLKGVPESDGEQYTFDELKENWQKIFTRDQEVDESPHLQDAYSPKCRHGTGNQSTFLLATQHQLRIVDSRGKVVEGTSIAYCRTKSGVGALFKMAEYLIGIRADGSPRVSIDDYLATLTRDPDPDRAHRRSMQLIEKVAGDTNICLDEILRLKGYSLSSAKELKERLIDDSEVGDFVRGRNDLVFKAEPFYGEREGINWFEVLIPVSIPNSPELLVDSKVARNFVCWQAYDDGMFTKIEGKDQTSHTRYKIKRELSTAEGFTAWHWSIMRRLAPFFLDEHMLKKFAGIYEKQLSLEP